LYCLGEAPRIDKVRSDTQRHPTVYMSENRYTPDQYEVPVLIGSESGSDDGLTSVMEYCCTPSNLEVTESTGQFDTSNGFATKHEESYQYPVKESLLSTLEDPFTCTDTDADADPDERTINENFISMGVEPPHSPATVPPKHVDDEAKDDYVRQEVSDTCAELLVKLETVRLSVLHLQYSLHAGALGAAQLETRDRSSRLWAWDKSSTLSDIFPTGVSEGSKTSEGFKLSEEAFSEIKVFGGTDHSDNIDNEISDDTIRPESFDGLSAESCV
jgi:hypothetical protein